MSNQPREHSFDLAKRSAEKHLSQEQSERKEPEIYRAEDAHSLSKSIDEFYGPKFPGRFDVSVHGPIVTVRKKDGGSTFTIEFLGAEKFRLSGGSGPGGFGADVAVNMSEVNAEEMMDTLEEWFNISTS